MPETQPDLAQHVAWLSSILRPGYSLVRTKHAWYFKAWDPGYITRYGEPRMSWKDIDSDKDLAALLARLGEPG